MTDLQKNFPEQEGKEFVFRHYGYSPTLVHRNPHLSPGAKGLYAYLSTFVNADQMKEGKLHAWPSRKRILKDMNISVNTFGKYLKELKEAGFLRVEQGRKTLKEGKQVFGNNLYIFQTYVTSPSEGEISSTEDCDPEQNSHSESDQPNPCNSHQMNTSNTQGFSTTKNKSKINLSTTRQEEASQSQGQIMELEIWSYLKEKKEKEIRLDDLIAFWNQAGINPHYFLGQNTRVRMQIALEAALEDHSLSELLGTITTYAKLYKARKARHKYRLVEFLEKRGYEHFLEEKNWDRLPPREKITREDFTYKESQQDRSRFPWLNPDAQEDTASDPSLDST